MLVDVSQGAQAHNKHRYKWPSWNGYRFGSVQFIVAKKIRCDIIYDISFTILWFVVAQSNIYHFSKILTEIKIKRFTKRSMHWIIFSWLPGTEFQKITSYYTIDPKKIISICSTYYNNLFRFKECKSNQRKQGLLIVRSFGSRKHVYAFEAVEKLTGKNRIMNTREKRHARATTLRGSILWSSM